MLQVDEQNHIRTLRLSRPPVNALSSALLQELAAAVRDAPKSGARGIVLTGSGRHFCAGLDVRELLAADAGGLDSLLGGLLDAMHAIAASPIPVVAAINGHSPAGGAVLALACDWRILADGDTRIGLNEVAVGLCPGPVIHELLVSLVGARQAAQMLTGGLMLPASQALQTGFVDALAAAGEVEAEAVRWLGAHLRLPQHAYLATRRMVRAPMVELLASVTGPQRAATLARFRETWLSDETRTTLSDLLNRASGVR